MRPLALASLAVIVGLFFAQLVQLSDLLLFQHAACEHGELIHVPARGPVKVEAANDDQRQHLGAAPASEGDHEHCDALALRYGEGSVALHVLRPTLLVWLDSPVIVLGSSRRPIALLAVAPKASPPRG